MRSSATRTHMLTVTALLAAFTAVLAQIQLPIGPVPFHLAVFGVFLSGMLLPPLWAFASVLVYLLLGVFGLPVFAGFQGGPAALLGKTGGYLLGYLAIACFTAFAASRCKRFGVIFLSMLLGLAVCYALGTLWFMLLTGAELLPALTLCVFPFLLPDLGKAVLAYSIGCTLRRHFPLLHH